MMPPDVLAPRQAGGQNRSMETAELPKNLELCHGMIRELSASYREAQRRIEQLEHRLDLLLRRIYGPKSERFDPDQMLLFADQIVEDTGTTDQDDPTLEEAPPQPRRPM
jgi:transposase